MLEILKKFSNKTANALLSIKIAKKRREILKIKKKLKKARFEHAFLVQCRTKVNTPRTKPLLGIKSYKYHISPPAGKRRPENAFPAALYVRCCKHTRIPVTTTLKQPLYTYKRYIPQNKKHILLSRHIYPILQYTDLSPKEQQRITEAIQTCNHTQIFVAKRKDTDDDGSGTGERSRKKQ